MSLERYSATRDDTLAALERVDALLADPALAGAIGSEDRALLQRAAERLRDRPFVLAFVGEFSSGKSFLLNALLEKVAREERAGSTRIVGLLATDINPSTATITELAYAPEERAIATYADGREERIALDRLSRFVAVGDEAKLHDATGDERGAPVRVRVEIDSPFLRGGFVVADTPGLASINPAHRRATLGYLPGADAVLYLIDTQQPFSEGDASFLGIIRRYIESIFVVQTKIDLWRVPSESNDGNAREAWQTAYARIHALTERYAPRTPVFPLSAREYAEGRLLDRPELVDQSRFPAFRSALDASLAATAGRSRLRRIDALAGTSIDRARATIARYDAAFGRDRDQLVRERAALEPELAALQTRIGALVSALHVEAGAVLAELDAHGATLREDLHRSLARAFDVTDIARLRDRAKLHIVVDETVAGVIGTFAETASNRIALRIENAADALFEQLAGDTVDEHLGPVVRDAVAEPIPFADFGARRFGAEPGTGTWSSDLAAGLRSEIVLGAIAGPAVGLVAAIAGRFASARHGSYMKRELQADLGAHFFPAFDVELASFLTAFAERASAILSDVAAVATTIETRARAATTLTLDRVLEAHDERISVSERRSRLQQLDEALVRERVAIAGHLERFLAESGDDLRIMADPDVPLDPTLGTLPQSGSGSPFDTTTYEHGLRPERWRVAVLGALRRGKSSLINAIAGRRVLDDEGAASELRFPVHVRYGPELQAYELGDDAGWNPIEPQHALAAAARTPVLIEVPWRLPKQLVLVHTPAFDSGDPRAAEIVLAAARAASETLCLFSRQLSDRELDLFARVSHQGTPQSFVHTLADNETANERRDVVELAQRYLGERGITAQRTYTISALDFRRAHDERTTAAPWNELGALISTLEAHAEEHMRKLAQTERDRKMRERLAANDTPAETPRTRTFFARLLGR